MSQFTFATIIRDKKREDIIKALQDEKFKGYLFAANKDWQVAVIEDEMENGQINAERLSQVLNTHVFFFYNAEDHGWGYDLYLNGRTIASLQVDYDSEETPEDSNNFENANLSYLREICANPEDIDKLEKYLESYLEDPEIMWEGVSHFKSAFGFEDVEWVSYHYFEDEDEEFMKERGIVVIS